MSKNTFTIYLKKDGKPANNVHIEISSHNDGDYLDNNATMYTTGEIVDGYAEYTSKRNWSAAKVYINGRFHGSYNTKKRIDL